MMMWLAVTVQAVLLLVLAVGAYLWGRSLKRRTAGQLELLEKRIDFNARQQEHSKLEVEELRAGIIGVGQRVLKLESALTQLNNHLSSSLQELSDKQQAMEMTDPESKIYSRAMKMVQLGADLDEIMRECELPRAEAELLFSLHQQKRQL